MNILHCILTSEDSILKWFSLDICSCDWITKNMDDALECALQEFNLRNNLLEIDYGHMSEPEKK